METRLTSIRIHMRDDKGLIFDSGRDFGLEVFGGVCPVVGDTIVDPGARDGADRHLPENRTVWKVTDRIFQAKGEDDYVVLVVSERAATEAEVNLL